jgi:DNA-directed RNA polymerase specialized sigma24 family protein
MADPLYSLIQRLRSAGDAEPLGDVELLNRFVRTRDPAAFEVLVWRHGAMVLGAAHRLLGNDADAEDAFQATFLTLARKAASIRRGGALAAWLHLVACRVARRMHQQQQSLRPLDGHDVAAPESPPPDDVAGTPARIFRPKPAPWSR